ncbi:MAG: polysaccharide deacetylase family protein [Myxococcota bacterium]
MSEGLGGPWPGGALAAYSIIHDDVGDPLADGFLEQGLPELDARGLHAGLAIVVSEAARRGLFPKLRTAVTTGHEAINHSWSHADLTKTTNFGAEIDAARAVLEAELSRRVTFFAFPFDEWNDEGLAHLRAAGYRGARAGERGLNKSEPGNEFEVRFDTYGEEHSIYKGKGDVLEAYVDDAIANQGWAVREFHGVADQSWESIPLPQYRAHLDNVAERVREGSLWVATPSAVLRWRRHRARISRPFPRLVRSMLPC